jgi:PPK2 family polyphosphate:nucleotide phosphotransferase
LCESEAIKGQLRFAYDLVEPLLVAPGSGVDLRKDFDPGYTGGLDGKAAAEARLSEGIALLADYHERLSAQDSFGVLFVLQGIDAAGKDSTVKHVLTGLNPKGVRVHNFKEPSEEELSHDFLWRYQRALPERGQIGVFNRSHYEEVLVVRVHPDLLEAEQLPQADEAGDVWKRRYREINQWEHYLVDNGIHVVKVFLNLSKREQAKRFIKRIDEPEKNWKFAPSDIRERDRWDDYRRAFEEMLSHTSTERAPWYVIPADHKWFSRLAAAAILTRTLAEIDPRYPEVADEVRREMTAARAKLVEEMSLAKQVRLVDETARAQALSGGRSAGPDGRGADRSADAGS